MGRGLLCGELSDDGQTAHINQSKKSDHRDEHKAVYVFRSENPVISLQHVKRHGEVEQTNIDPCQDRDM